MYETKSEFRVFGPKGRSASKCSWVLLMFTLSARVLQEILRNYTLGFSGENVLAFVAFPCHLPINLTLSRNNQQNHLQSSHQSCYPSKPNNDKLEKSGWVSHWCIYQRRMSSNQRAQSNRTQWQKILFGFSVGSGAFKRLLWIKRELLKS